MGLIYWQSRMTDLVSPLEKNNKIFFRKMSEASDYANPAAVEPLV